MLRVGMFGVFIMALTGCAIMRPVVDDTRHFVLAAPVCEPLDAGAVDGEITVSVLRVRLPRYLEGPAIVVREGAYRVHYSSRNVWAEPLDQGIERILRNALDREPLISRVVAYPLRRGDAVDYDVHVSIQSAEGVIREGGVESHGIFRATWEIRRGLDSTLVSRGDVNKLELAWDGEDFGQLVGGISSGAFHLAQEVVNDLKRLHGG